MKNLAMPLVLGLVLAVAMALIGGALIEPPSYCSVGQIVHANEWFSC